MKEAKVVIGANFGDEGKGLMTDYFCSQFPKDKKVLNVRFNGGAQAGHTVVTPDGKRHVFSHFGSGSFLPNVATYLSREFIVNPILFRREYETLRSMGIYPMIYMHPRCLVTVPQDMMVNQYLETARGKTRHGSCGVGIFETKLRSGLDRPMTIDTIANFSFGWGLMDPDVDYYNAERIEKVLGEKLPDHVRELMCNQNIRAHYNSDVRFMLEHVTVTDEIILSSFDYVVFEGAQGLMLDQNNLDYFPHLTPSNTGITNVIPYMNLEDDANIEICYVTRPYLTRHGAGKLPDECLRESVGAKIDLTNHKNEWQGAFRYGRLNWKNLLSRCREDVRKAFPLYTSWSIAVTHVDEVHDVLNLIEIKNGLIEPDYPIKYLSSGPTRNDVSTELREEVHVKYEG
ncbi:MAG: adenylosuccinate synthetase [Bacteroidota bacterium]|nr:adenylosuccinate synthetase [Bacteroidota bacterium]